MLKKTQSLYLIAAFLIAACSQDEPNNGGDNNRFQPINLSRGESEVAKQNNQFAWRLFQGVDSCNSGNVIFSPASASFALSMNAIGACDTVREEIFNLIGFDGVSIDDINSYNQKLINNLEKIDNTTKIKIANSAWCVKELNIRDWYEKDLSSFYSSFNSSFDLSDSSRDAINKWCAKSTDNLIPKIIDRIKDGDKLIVLNALYFKSEWTKGFTFDKQNTKIEAFYNSDGSKSLVNFMKYKKSVNLPYFDNNEFKIISIPFGNGAFSFTVVLPNYNNNKTIADCISWINSNSWNEISSNMQSMNIKLQIPKFEIKNDIDLNPALENIGAREMFMLHTFPGLLSPKNPDKDILGYTNISQGNYFKIDEEGATAASVTNVSFVLYTAPLEMELRVDHPFIYMIREKSTGAILFIGKVENF